MSSVNEHMMALGFSWTPTHAMVCLRTPDGRRFRVAIPAAQVQADHATELAKVGCHMPAAVGAQSAVGFFKALKRAVRRVSRGVRRIVPRAIRRAARRVYRRAARAVKRLRRVARSVIRSPYLKGALVAASFIPGAAAITAPSLAAIQMADTIDRKIAEGERAARMIARGVRNATTERAKREGLAAFNQVKTISRAARNPANRAARDFLGAFAQKLQ